MRVKNVLVPVDFSPPSKLAVDYGVAFARAFHARLTLLHVLSPTAPSAGMNETRDIIQNLSGLVSPEDQADLDLNIVAKTGSVDDGLRSVIREHGVDFVVMGTHGRGFLGRMLIGSETHKMLRKMETSVVTVCHAHTGLNFGRILFATDLSAAAEHAYQFVLDIAEAHQSDLTIMHVIDLPGDMEAAHKAIQELVAQAEIRGIKAESVLVNGHPAEQILAVADTHNVDLIVLGIEQKPFLERALLGVTAERVIREAYVPVLSIPLAARLNVTATVDEAKQAS